MNSYPLQWVYTTADDDKGRRIDYYYFRTNPRGIRSLISRINTYMNFASTITYTTCVFKHFSFFTYPAPHVYLIHSMKKKKVVYFCSWFQLKFVKIITIRVVERWKNLQPFSPPPVVNNYDKLKFYMPSTMSVAFVTKKKKSLNMFLLFFSVF